MQIGRKFRLHPDAAQAKTLAQWIGCARVVYNRKADEEQCLSWLRRYGKFSARAFAIDEGKSGFIFDQAYSHLKGSKAEEPWMHEVPPEVLRNAMYQRKEAWAKHWKNPEHFGQPGRRIKGINDSILLTKELFAFTQTGRIRLAARANRVVGNMPFRQHRDFKTPNSVTVSHDTDGRWWLSLSFEDDVESGHTQGETMRDLAKLPDSAIAARVVGHDVGVVRSVTSSDGKVITFTSAKQAKIDRWNKRVARLQMHLARKVKGSGKSRKAKRRIARVHSKAGDLRNDHAHQVSRAIVTTNASVIAFEGLKLRNMIRKPKPVRDEVTGGFGPNGVRAKAGLNKSLLNAVLGKIISYTGYKAGRLGKIAVRVPAANSSRECSRCHHTSADNRPTQAQFHCMACGFTANADDNASVIVAQRATHLLFSVLGRSTQTTPEEAAKTLGLDETLLNAARDSGSRSTHLAA
jgi:putative transposase